MARGIFHRHRILNFAVGENAVKKFIAESLERTIDARALNQIDTDAEHTHVRAARAVSELPSLIGRLSDDRSNV